MVGNLTNRLLVYIVLFFNCYTVLEASVQQDVDSGQLRIFLEKGYLNGISVLSDCKIVIETEEWRSPDWLENVGESRDAELIKITSEYIGKGKKEILSSTLQSKVFEYGVSRFAVFDGDFLLSFTTTKGLTDTETQRGRASLESPSGYRGIRFKSGGPLVLLGYEQEVALSDNLSRTDVTIHPEMQEVHDLLCYQVDAPIQWDQKYIFSYWICPQRSFLPVKVELRAEDGRLISKTDVTEFIELPNGGWFPKKVTRQGFKKKEAENEWLISTDTYNTKQIELYPEIDEAEIFNTSPENLPAGTLFSDMIAGMQYVIGEGPVSDERITSIIKKTLDEVPMVADANAGNEMSTKITESNSSSTKQIFTDTGVRALETGNQEEHIQENKTSIVGVALISVGITVILLITMVLVWKLNRIKGRAINDSH